MNRKFACHSKPSSGRHSSLGKLQKTRALVRRSALVCLILSLSAPLLRAHSYEITFDEVPTTTVDDLSVEGVTFDFKVNGLDSPAADFNVTGPPGLFYLDGSVLEGEAAGILSIIFNRPTPTLSFSAALDSVAFAATPGLTVDLFGIGFAPLGTLPLSLISNGPGLFIEGQFIYPGGPLVKAAVIDFNEAAGSNEPLFFLDNLRFSTAPPSPAPGRTPDDPEPYLLIDKLAIESANTTGLLMPAMHQQLLRGASRTALRDLNGRLFRARSHVPQVDSSIEQADRSPVLNYLDFAAKQNISYQVALGLREPQETEIVDTLRVSHPFAMVGAALPLGGSATTIVTAAPAGARDEADDGKEVIDLNPADEVKRWEIFSAADFRSQEQDVLTEVFRGYESQSWAGSLGVEFRPNHWSAIGVAYSHLWTDAEADVGIGSAEMDGNLFSIYGTAFFGRSWVDLLYSYGDFESELRRRTLVGEAGRAEPDSYVHHLFLNAGHNVPLAENLVTGPMFSLEFTSGSTEAYQESGSPRANLIYDEQDFDSLITRLGWQATVVRETRRFGEMQIQGRIAWEKEHLPANDRIGATLATSPFVLVTPGVGAERIGGYGSSSPQAHPGSDWVAIGLGVRFHLYNDFDLLFDYEGHLFRNQATIHYGSVRLSRDF